MKAHRIFGASIVAGSLFFSTLALAQGKPVQVVAIDSDDAEDQADAFTGALKSRIRAQSGWQLGDSTSSLGPLLMALKCPPKPDAGCLTRMGDQLKADKFFWGTMKKAGKNVTLELHFWTRGKPDQTVTESYSDNLKDQNDETLRKIASRLFEKMTGATGGTPTPTGGGTQMFAVKVNVEEGTVFVDGLEKGKIEHGVATIELPAGPHDIEVRSEGKNPAKQHVTAAAGPEATVNLELTAATPPPPPGPSKPFPVRKVIGFSVAGLGVVAGVIGLVEGIQFLDLQSKNTEFGKKYPTGTNFCTSPAPLGPNSDECKNLHDGETARMLEFVFFGAGAALIATGLIIVLTDKGSPSADQPAQAKIRLVPSIGPTGGGMGLVGTF